MANGVDNWQRVSVALAMLALVAAVVCVFLACDPASDRGEAKSPPRTGAEVCRAVCAPAGLGSYEAMRGICVCASPDVVRDASTPTRMEGP